MQTDFLKPENGWAADFRFHRKVWECIFVSHYALLVPLMVPDVAIDNPKCWHDTLPEVGAVSGLHDRPNSKRLIQRLLWLRFCSRRPTQPGRGRQLQSLNSWNVPTKGWIFLRFAFFFEVTHFHKKLHTKNNVVQCLKSTLEIRILLSLPIFDKVNQIKWNQVMIGVHK